MDYEYWTKTINEEDRKGYCLTSSSTANVQYFSFFIQ